jgi:hypothetical protein
LLLLLWVAGGLSQGELALLAHAGQEWGDQCHHFVSGMRACGWCGRVAFACRSNNLYNKMRALENNSTEMPCAVASNPSIKELAAAGAPSGVPAQSGAPAAAAVVQPQLWWACSACFQSVQRRQLMQRLLRPLADDDADFIRALLLLPPEATLQLSVLRCGLRLVQRAYGYWQGGPFRDTDAGQHGRSSQPALLSGPVAVHSQVSEEDAGTDHADTTMQLEAIIKAHLEVQHPILLEYKTMYEVDLGISLQDAQVDDSDTRTDSELEAADDHEEGVHAPHQ